MEESSQVGDVLYWGEMSLKVKALSLSIDKFLLPSIPIIPTRGLANVNEDDGLVMSIRNTSIIGNGAFVMPMIGRVDGGNRPALQAP